MNLTVSSPTPPASIPAAAPAGPALKWMWAAIGVLGVSVLALGRIPFQPDRSVDVSTRFFAKLSLLAWPVAAVLLAGTAFLMYDVYAYYRTRERAGSDDKGKAPVS